jgi:hypothetical protein
MMIPAEPASVPSDQAGPLPEQLRLAVAAYLARFKGSSREHTEKEEVIAVLMACRLHDVVLGGDPPTVVFLHENQHLREPHLSAWHAGDARVEVDNGDVWADQADLPYRRRELCSRKNPLKSLLGGTNDLIAAKIESAVGIGKGPIWAITSPVGSRVTCVPGLGYLSHELTDCHVDRYLIHDHSFPGPGPRDEPCPRYRTYSNRLVAILWQPDGCVNVLRRCHGILAVIRDLWRGRPADCAIGMVASRYIPTNKFVLTLLVVGETLEV